MRWSRNLVVWGEKYKWRYGKGAFGIQNPQISETGQIMSVCGKMNDFK